MVSEVDSFVDCKTTVMSELILCPAPSLPLLRFLYKCAIDMKFGAVVL